MSHEDIIGIDYKPNMLYIYIYIYIYIYMDTLNSLNYVWDYYEFIVCIN